jgi:thiamine biosynthesis lipoprotein
MLNSNKKTMNNPAGAISIKPNERGVRSVVFRALGSSCKINFIQPDEQAALKFLAEALSWLETFEKKYSRFNPKSEVSQINAAAGIEWVKVDHHMEHILDLINDLHRMSEGILDPTTLPLMKVWDWKTVHTEIPNKEVVDAALMLTGWKKVQRKPGAIFLPHKGMGIDFGGFGKEFAVDHLIRIAHQNGIADVLVDLGQDLFALGGNGLHPFWHVGIQDGRHKDKYLGGLAVSGFAVSSSGDYERRFEHDGVRYGHIIDPRTGWPVSNGMCSVTALAPSCLQAGVLSTTVFVLGREKGIAFATRAQDVEACIQDDRGTEKTPGFIDKQVQAA